MSFGVIELAVVSSYSDTVDSHNPARPYAQQSNIIPIVSVYRVMQGCVHQSINSIVIDGTWL